MKKWMVLGIAAVLGTAQFGCNDDDSSSGGSAVTCSGSFAACGGDISGTWTIDNVCVEGDISEALASGSDLPDECTDMVQSMTVDASGTVTFANGVETNNIKLTETAEVRITAECISAILGGTKITLSQDVCELFAKEGASEATADDPSSSSMTCKFANSACECTSKSSSGIEEETMAYTTSGNVLTNTDDGSTLEYCVSGSTLSVRDKNAIGDVALRFTAHK